MNKERVVRWLIVLALISAFSYGWVNNSRTEASPERVRVIVTHVQGEDEEETKEIRKAVEKLIKDIDGRVIHRYDIIPALAAEVPPDEIGTIEADPLVESVEMDGMAYALEEVLPWGVDRVDAELVHPTNKGAGVKVAILDSGIDLDHPDLNVVGDVTFVEGTTSGDDTYGHGTRVAGIVAALDNDIGVIGVAPEVELYAVRVMMNGGGVLWSDAIAGINWSWKNGMHVINMSFGSPNEPPPSYYNSIKQAYKKGVVLVAGAGNRGDLGLEDSVIYPAKYSQVIAVGATDDTDTRPADSSTGPDLELVAPGVSIYSTAMGGGYGYMTGTSTSSPHAAGVAALLIASGVTDNDEVRARLQQTAHDLGNPGWDEEYGYGLVDAYQAVNP